MELPGKKSLFYALLHRRLFHLSIVGVLAAVIYTGTISSQFHFDDFDYVINNPIIRDTGLFFDQARRSEIFFSDSLIRYTFRGRLVGYLTFAFNYSINGLSPSGYHLFNVSVHIINALLVYALTGLLLKTPAAAQAGPDFSGPAYLVPFLSALLFVCHPLQTQAVTYISQRFASLAAMFYLLSAVSYISARLSFTKRMRMIWYSSALIAALLAAGTKEISFTLPFVMFIIELLFFEGRKKGRLLRLAPFLLLALIIPINALSVSQTDEDLSAAADGIARAKTDISRTDYFVTQFRVIVTYLRLMFLPVNQNFDYDYPLLGSLFNAEAALSLALLCLVIGAGLYLFRRSGGAAAEGLFLRIAAFGIFWFFMTISVESSVIPTNDLIFEHRFYLPSFGAFAAVSCLTAFFLHRRPRTLKAVGIAFIVIVMLFSFAAFQRNGVWSDDIGLWQDVIRKSPEKARPYNELGRAFFNAGKDREAIEAFDKALVLNPAYDWAHYNRGLSLYKLGRYEDALLSLTAAAASGLRTAEVFNNIGALYYKKGLSDDAMNYFVLALSENPFHADSWRNLGVVYRDMGMHQKSAECFDKAHRLNPGKY